jgi:uncharacterized repeat protein (TIGR03843 family)
MSPLSNQAILTALKEGKAEMKGEFMWGSNYTFLLQIDHGTAHLQAVYKPTRGVRPLWDFPSASLARREVAAFLVSEALGWSLVPWTTYRKDGPFGPGSVQLFIEHDPEYHYFNFSENDRQRLRPAALFDLLINNADRKGSHVLIDPEKHLWLIDHGICFHVEDKLRTVIWDFAGEPIPEKLCADLDRFQAKLSQFKGNERDDDEPELASTLEPYLSASEITMLARRARLLVAEGRFPNPEQGRRQYPWPPV